MKHYTFIVGGSNAYPAEIERMLQTPRGPPGSVCLTGDLAKWASHLWSCKTSHARMRRD